MSSSLPSAGTGVADRSIKSAASGLAIHWLAPALLGCVLCLPVEALEYQLHGYAAQGFALSSGNNVFGDSTEGSLSYYEVGLNAEIQVRPRLLLAVQGAIRDAGVTDTGVARLDYALMDYRIVSGADANAGIRIGKVKNPLGFFNETRDVIFTRPSILLPFIYSDNQNQRDLVFAAPGVQLYGSAVRGRHEWSATGTASADRYLSAADERLLVVLPVPSSLHMKDSWNGQIMDSIDGGRWQFAVSLYYARLVLNALFPSVPPASIYGNFGVGVDVISARYNAERFSLTAEYAINPNRDFVTLGGNVIQNFRIVADSGYLQGDYRINSRWSVLARADAYFRDRGDRDGRAFAAAHSGASAASRYAYDLTAGLNWRPNARWGVWGEYHWIDGSATVQALDNTGRVPADHWSTLMLMAGLRF
jgi:hypothetical protein